MIASKLLLEWWYK